MQKVKSKWIKDLDIGPDYILYIGENMGRNLCDIETRSVFKELMPSAKETRKDKKNETTFY